MIGSPLFGALSHTLGSLGAAYAALAVPLALAFGLLWARWPQDAATPDVG